MIKTVLEGSPPSFRDTVPGSEEFPGGAMTTRLGRNSLWGETTRRDEDPRGEKPPRRVIPNRCSLDYPIWTKSRFWSEAPERWGTPDRVVVCRVQPLNRWNSTKDYATYPIKPKILFTAYNQHTMATVIKTHIHEYFHIRRKISQQQMMTNERTNQPALLIVYIS
jgi:hypothetical protein